MTEKDDAFGSLGGGEATVGEAGAGETGVEAAEVLRRWSLLPLKAGKRGQLRDMDEACGTCKRTPILT